jgi:MFS family permease
VKLDKRVWIKVLAVDMLLLCFSLTVSVTGQMFGSIKQFYGLTLTQASLLLSVQSIGGMLLAVLCILFISVFNKTKVLVLSGLVLCVSLMLAGAVPPLLILFAVFAILGFSGGAVNTLTNSVMADTVPNKADRYIHFMHMLFSFGAVTAPVISQAISFSLGFSGAFLIFGGFALCWAVFAVFAFPASMKNKLATRTFSFQKQYREAAGILRMPGMGMTFFVSIMITAWQLSATYYISSYFTGLTGQPMDGALALSLLFLGMMVSRLAYAHVADRFSKGRVLMLSNALGLLAWAVVILVPDIHVKYMFVALSALACGNNFPIVFSAACRIAPQNTGVASGFVNFGYYIAIFSFIPTVGALGDAAGLNTAMALCAVPLLLIIPAGYMLHKKTLVINHKITL